MPRCPDKAKLPKLVVAEASPSAVDIHPQIQRGVGFAYK
jgi:hypothetical protein